MMNINENNIAQSAEELYRNGHFYCSEAVLKSVIEGFGEVASHHIVAMASGFPVGIGGAGCTCGALSGGIMAIGYFFGRSENGAPEVKKAMGLSKELHDKFRDMNKCTCCRILTKGMEKGSKEHLEQCIRFTGEMAKETALIIKQNL